MEPESATTHGFLLGQIHYAKMIDFDELVPINGFLHSAHLVLAEAESITEGLER
jgi:hypothetical protein